MFSSFYTLHAHALSINITGSCIHPPQQEERKEDMKHFLEHSGAVPDTSCAAFPCSRNSAPWQAKCCLSYQVALLLSESFQH